MRMAERFDSYARQMLVTLCCYTVLDLSCPIEVMTDMTKSRKLGLTGYRASDESFFDLFAQLRAERLIP